MLICKMYEVYLAAATQLMIILIVIMAVEDRN